ncbi:Imm8 family immunity protein [Roseateles chitinivorans]|uniref:Imm8 family immunity protein n=1 Tax=Roseateles chitinivorans TaxID=2917965 RepID=UPI003D67F157
MTLQAQLKRLHSPDLPDLQNGHPPDPGNFRILVQALVGVAGQEAADSFDFMVCTPAWLAARVTEPLPARGYLIVTRYDYAQIHAAIARLCDGATGPDWPAVAARLNLDGRWEYDEDR